MEIKEKIRQFIIDELKGLSENGEVDYINDDTPLLENGLIDSMMILSLIAFLEENYGVLLNEEDLKRENFANIQKIYKLVLTKIEKH